MTLSVLKHLQTHKDIPLFGNAEEFDLDLFSTQLKEKLHYEDLQCHIRERDFKEASHFLKGLGPKPTIISLNISPIPVPIHFAISKNDKSKIVQEIGSLQSQKKIFSSSSLEDGYFRYLILETLNIFQNLDPIRQMSLHLLNDETLPEEIAFCIDIEIALAHTSCWGRLIIPDSFRKHWIQHFSAFPLEYGPKAESKPIELKLALNIGSVTLTPQQIKKLKPLDILIPDSLTYTPESEDTSGILTLNNLSLIQTKILKNHLEIIDFISHPKENIMQEDILSEAEDTVSIKELPLEVSIELSRLTMPLGDILKLKAGNVIELPPHAEQRVSLAINGKKIGSAELVSLGETWALKIIDI